eukprot:6177886-Pleurochrysis_carterae.AAC.1
MARKRTVGAKRTIVAKVDGWRESGRLARKQPIGAQLVSMPVLLKSRTRMPNCRVHTRLDTCVFSINPCTFERPSASNVLARSQARGAHSGCVNVQRRAPVCECAKTGACA